VKNFPHQYNQFPKLRATLETVAELHGRSDDVTDDGVLGYALARRGIYTFRDDTRPLEQLIASERLKDSSNQGPRTAARDLLRTLRYLGWIGTDGSLTEQGTAILATATGSPEEQAEWQRALLELTLSADGHVSHPIRILLRLVRDHSIVERQGAELALEARDDSDEEYQRISALIRLPERERTERMGSTAYQVANARKIIPSFAEQANLIRRADRGSPYVLTETGSAALGEGYTSRPVELRPETRTTRTRRVRGVPRRVRRGDIARPSGGTGEGWSSLSHEEQIAATRLRFERTERHQDLVASLLELLEEDGVQLFEDGSSFDLLRVPGEPAAVRIYEVKTLETDDLTQTRLAIGQLLSYEHLNVRPRYPDRGVELAAVYERAVDEELLALLDAIGIAAYALSDGVLEALNDTARRFG
jgi:hypothetical protein